MDRLTMTPHPETKQETKEDAPRPPLPTILSSIEVQQVSDVEPNEPSEVGSDAPRKSKRRSGNSVDLSYRYHEPSDDELSWTEDEHGTRRRRKSNKRKSGGGDDFKTCIV